MLSVCVTGDTHTSSHDTRTVNAPRFLNLETMERRGRRRRRRRDVGQIYLVDVDVRGIKCGVIGLQVIGAQR
jgi:hypothetical protein